MKEKRVGFFNIAHHDYYEYLDNVSIRLAKEAIDSLQNTRICFFDGRQDSPSENIN